MNYLNIEIPEDRKELYSDLNKKYNPEGSKLRNYQHHLTKTLLEFDRICRENDIHYSLAYGTMLGAIRHKDFIPWDDDADLFMDRENYEKLHALMKGPYHELSDKLSVCMGIRPELWMPPYSYIDIFILDNCPDNKILRFIKYYMTILLYMLYKCRNRIGSRDFKRIKPWYIMMPIAIIGSKNFWKKAYEKAQQLFPLAKSSLYKTYNSSLSGIKLTYSKEYFSDYVYVEFDNHWFPIYSSYDYLLKKSYGDYMSLPTNLHIHGFVDSIPVTEVKE